MDVAQRTMAPGGGMFLAGRDHRSMDTGSQGMGDPQWGGKEAEILGCIQEAVEGFLEAYQCSRCREQGCYECGAEGAAGGNMVK